MNPTYQEVSRLLESAIDLLDKIPGSDPHADEIWFLEEIIREAIDSLLPMLLTPEGFANLLKIQAIMRGANHG